MGAMDIVLIILIAACLVGAVASIIRHRSDPCGGCHACDRKNGCPSGRNIKH